MNYHEKRHHFMWRQVLCALMLLGALVTFTSCGDDDEPSEMVVDYYIDVEEEFLVNGSTELIDRFHNPIDLMREAIRTTYPKPNTVGDDQAVIAACDEVYSRFYSMYSNRNDHMTSLFNLKKVYKRGDIVKQSELLKTYTIDVNPPVVE